MIKLPLLKNTSSSIISPRSILSSLQQKELYSPRQSNDILIYKQMMNQIVTPDSDQDIQLRGQIQSE
ncbi:hypothetical protein SS50377_22023 [Spironucleus salmonicida]|uniref:Uncharacterized protein n=1 Tax=Spironucleus salmonicida TaxID=348837 RepID=V6LM94_9EUKA|nr:hypothetical protein SS50377_22023 [Spironucleus salmonicida]|eukprot:EST45812.1 Hypothetical protein SS50377_jh021 [Spironucleus salmonicida]